MDYFTLDTTEYANLAWVLHVFLVVLATGIVSVFSRYMLQAMARKTAASKNLWDDALFHALRRPLKLFIWAMGLSFAFFLAYEGKDEAMRQAAHTARDMAIIVSLAWFGLRFVRYCELHIFDHAQKTTLSMDPTTISALAKLLRVTIFITAVLVAMQTLGFSITGVLAFGGIGGMAVGFAAKDLLANFFGALMIYLDRPFAVGDWVRSPDQNIEGTIEDIGWRQTRIRTFDKRPIYVPNSVFSTIVVENPSRMSHRRIYETIGLRYDDIAQVHAIVEKVEAMLKSHPDIATDQTLMVYFNSFGASSLDFFLYTFTKTTNWEEFHRVKQDVLLKVADIIEAHRAEIAFPTRTLHVQAADGTELAGNLPDPDMA